MQNLTSTFIKMLLKDGILKFKEISINNNDIDYQLFFYDDFIKYAVEINNIKGKIEMINENVIIYNDKLRQEILKLLKKLKLKYLLEII